jgi:hypothetical protein
MDHSGSVFALVILDAPINTDGLVACSAVDPHCDRTLGGPEFVKI